MSDGLWRTTRTEDWRESARGGRFEREAMEYAAIKYRRKRGQMCRKGVQKKIDRFVVAFLAGIVPIYSNQVVYSEHPRWGCVLTGVDP